MQLKYNERRKTKRFEGDDLPFIVKYFFYPFLFYKSRVDTLSASCDGMRIKIYLSKGKIEGKKTLKLHSFYFNKLKIVGKVIYLNAINPFLCIAGIKLEKEKSKNIDEYLKYLTG